MCGRIVLQNAKHVCETYNNGKTQTNNNLILFFFSIHLNPCTHICMRLYGFLPLMSERIVEHPNSWFDLYVYVNAFFCLR